MVAPQPVSVTFTDRRFDSECKWCRSIKAQITVGSDKQAGKILAYLIHRPLLRQHYHTSRETFHGYMDMPTQDICNVGKGLFDRHGRLRKRLRGTFGPEADQGNLLYIRDVELKEPLAKKGYGIAALKQLLEKLNAPEAAVGGGGGWSNLQTTTWQFAVMHPEESEDSWRPAGFRIIHATERYLGCVADPSHRCYNTTEVDPPLPLEHLDPPQAELDMELAEAVQGGQFVDMMGGRMKMSEGPPDCTKVNQLLERGASITRSRAILYAAGAGQWDALLLLKSMGGDINERDPLDNTGMHIAVLSGAHMFETLQLLLALGADPSIKNNLGRTPLDLLILQMETLRDFSDALLGGFKGHEEATLKAITLLQAVAASVRGPLASLPIPRGKWGCTCGQCLLDGCLSPRMMCRLRITAEVLADIMRDNINTMVESWPASVDDTGMIFGASWLPVQFQQQMSKRFAKGYEAGAQMAAALLNANTPPTAAALNAAIGATTLPLDRAARLAYGHYIQQGGRAEFVIDAIVGIAIEQSEATGDGEFLEIHGDQLQGLPECENDDDFKLVLKQLCNAGHQPRGPYNPYEREAAGGDSDDFEEDDDDEEADSDEDDDMFM